MPYTPDTWANNDPTKPLNATRLTKLAGQYPQVMADLPGKIADSGDPIGAALSSTIVSAVSVVNGLGQANDAPTIEAALAAANAFGIGRVVIPNGVTANISSSALSVPAGARLVLEKSAVIKRTSGTGQVAILAAGAVIEGGTLDGNNTSIYVASVSGHGSALRGVTVKNGQYGVGVGAYNDLTVLDCTFTGNTSYAVFVEGAAARPIISRNRITGTQGIMFKDGISNGLIQGNMLTISGGVGIECLGATVVDIVVSGNNVHGTPTIGISLASAKDSVVIGNTVQGHTSIGLEVAEGCTDCSVVGNVVNEGNVGINVTTSNAGTKPLRNITVIGNTVKAQASYGISTEYGTNLRIIDNLVQDSVNHGISVRNSPDRCTIDGNTVVSTDAVANRLGIQVSGVGHIVSGNTVDNSRRTTVGGGLRIEGGSDHLVTGNRVFFADTGISVNNSARTVLDGNRTDGTTTASVNFYNASSVSSVLLTHMMRYSTGAGVQNSAGATLTGPQITL